MNEQQHSLRTIFVEALEIEDAEARAAFLSRSCAGDPGLRREVEELIQAHLSARHFLPEQPATKKNGCFQTPASRPRSDSVCACKEPSGVSQYSMPAPGCDSSELAPTGARFTTTHWSVVVAAGEATLPGAVEALEQLCRAYWYPLYAYVRRRGHPPEDAQDLTQEFFQRLLTSDWIARADQ